MKPSLLPSSTLPVTSSKFYSEDIVFRINKKGQFEHGLVIENYDDASSDDEEDIINELLSIPPLKRGHIRVAWHPNGRKQVISEKKVHLLNRCFSPGDIVKSVSDNKNLGFVFHSNVVTTIQVIGSKKVVVNVNSEDLVPLDEYPLHRVIYYQDWVGIIREVKTRLNLMTADGSRCSFHSEEFPILDDANDNRDFSSEFKKFDYYPGQQLYGPAHNFAKSEWKVLKKDTKNALNNLTHIIEVTVESTAVSQIKVQWLCPAFSQNPSAKSSPPSEFITGNNLPKVKKLDFFFSNTVQIGDRMYYTLKETDLILNLPDWKENIFHFLQPEAGLMNHEEERSSQRATANGKLGEEADDDQEYESIESDDECRGGLNTSNSSHPRKERAKRRKLKNPTFTTTQGYTRRAKKPKRLKKNPPQLVLNTGDKVATEILAISTSVDVIWQDGTVEKDLPSSSLIPVQHIDNHDFFPGDFIVENKENPDCHCQKYGVVKKVDHKERVVDVDWVRPYAAGPRDTPELMRTDQLSVYDIKDHPDFRYRLGAIVIKIPKIGETQTSWAGQVMELSPIGMVQVKWADGSISACYPQDLYRIGGYDSDDLLDDYDTLSEDSSWQTESEMSLFGSEELSVGRENIKEEEPSTTNQDRLKSHRLNLSKDLESMKSCLSRIQNNFSKVPYKPKYPTDFFNKISNIYNNCKQFDSIFGTSYFNVNLDQFKAFLETLTTQQQDPPRAQENPTNNTATPSTSSGMMASQMCRQVMDELEKAYIFLQVLFDRLLEEERKPSVASKEEEPAAASLHSPEEALEKPLEAEARLVDLGQFTLLDEVPPHHTYKSSTFQPTSYLGLVKTIKKELKLLSNLPEGIIVKGYQERMDLFSALIKGPKKTPYEDGLFFFDIQLPGDYPKSPPQFHYISYCSGRLNPNLYDTGKVCVSLLGTWDGKGTEVWNPATSSLLQVLVSIQGLILVTEPYFNEANFEKQRATHQGKENSILYNEMVVIKLAQSMTALLHQPPQIFKQEIIQHFQAHAPSFLQRLENILALSENVNISLKYSPTSPSPQEVVINGTVVSVPTYLQLPASRGFCLSLRKALQAFKEAWAKLANQ